MKEIIEEIRKSRMSLAEIWFIDLIKNIKIRERSFYTGVIKWEKDGELLFIQHPSIKHFDVSQYVFLKFRNTFNMYDDDIIREIISKTVERWLNVKEYYISRCYLTEVQKTNL